MTGTDDERDPAASGPAPVAWLPGTTTELFGTGASAEDAYGLLTVEVPAASWISALHTCRDTLGCTYFDWLSAVDEPGTGFRVCTHVVALPGAGSGGGTVRRLLLCTTVPHDDPVLPTATVVYGGAGWHERETHEMFGVGFTGHGNLEPLLLPDNFEGHPLRKDFVLAARVAKAWPGAKEPGESGHGGAKRRQMLPPGVPDPNEWGPQKGRLPPVPSRPARGRAAAGERPARRTRTASAGSVSQERKAGGPADPGSPAERDAPAKPDAAATSDMAPAPGAQAASGTKQPAADAPAADAPWHKARPAFDESAAATGPDAAQAEPEAESVPGTDGTDGTGERPGTQERTGTEERDAEGRPGGSPKQPDEETGGDA